MERGTPLTRRKSLRSSSIIASGTKKVLKTPTAQKTKDTPLKKHIHQHGNNNLDLQKNGEADKENGLELINNVNYHNNTVGNKTPKNTLKRGFSSVHFDQTADDTNKKISTDSDIEFSDKMKQKKKKVNVQTNNTGIDQNNRKSVRFMPTKTVIHPKNKNISSEDEDEEFEATPMKCELRKSTPFVKRSKSSVITIDSTTTNESDVSESSQYQPITPLASKSSTTSMKLSTQKQGLRSGSISTNKYTENVASEVTPHVRSIAHDRPKRKTWSPQKYSCSILGTPYPASKSSGTPMKLSAGDGLSSANITTEKSNKKRTVSSTPYVRHSVHDGPKRKTRSPSKYSCVNLVTPNLTNIPEHSLKREGTFLVDSPSIVILDDTKSKIQQSFNESDAGPKSAKRQRKKWDKSAGIDISGFSVFDKELYQDENCTEEQRKNSDLFHADAPLEGPPPSLDEFLKNFKEDRAISSSTPLQRGRSKTPAEKPYSDNLIAKVIRKQVANVPNFAEIHQRNFQKMENIKDLIERKAKRAELLLSGQKPPAPVSSSKGSSIRKHLNYSPKSMPGVSGQKPPSTATSSKGSNVRKHLNYSPKKQPVPGVSTNVLNGVTKIPPVKKTSKPVEKKLEAAKVERKIGRPTKRRSLENEKNGFTRFGFKVGQEGVKKVSKDEHARAVATKTKVGAPTTDKRRILTQNVRTNRRFELLMQMRNKNK